MMNVQMFCIIFNEMQESFSVPNCHLSSLSSQLTALSSVIGVRCSAVSASLPYAYYVYAVLAASAFLRAAASRFFRFFFCAAVSWTNSAPGGRLGSDPPPPPPPPLPPSAALPRDPAEPRARGAKRRGRSSRQSSRVQGPRSRWRRRRRQRRWQPCALALQPPLERVAAHAGDGSLPTPQLFDTLGVACVRAPSASLSESAHRGFRRRPTPLLPSRPPPSQGRGRSLQKPRPTLRGSPASRQRRAAATAHIPVSSRPPNPLRCTQCRPFCHHRRRCSRHRSPPRGSRPRQTRAAPSPSSDGTFDASTCTCHASFAVRRGQPRVSIAPSSQWTTPLERSPRQPLQNVCFQVSPLRFLRSSHATQIRVARTGAAAQSCAGAPSPLHPPPPPQLAPPVLAPPPLLRSPPSRPLCAAPPSASDSGPGLLLLRNTPTKAAPRGGSRGGCCCCAAEQTLAGRQQP
mmetsp:Transcript_22746/g.74039  ORF Transcript_22746/g.74039 Transcript_22746/m.74039 type:complete len:459 (-) Transcript_22746:528-1904(-)